MAGFYDLLEVTYFRNYEKSPRKIVFEQIRPGDRVLDICTGTGTNAIHIAKEQALAKVVGVDLSVDMLRVAKEKVEKDAVKNVCLKRMDATALKIDDGVFDKVLLSLILHEMEELLAQQIIEEAKRVLKADGEIIVTEWEISREWWKRLLFFPISLLEPKPYRSFVKKDLQWYFENMGLELIDTEHCNYSKVLRLKLQ